MKYLRSQLSGAIRRNIKAHEKYLSRTCRGIWDHTNHLGERYLFARYCNGNGLKDTIIVTLGYYNENVNTFIPCYP